MRLQTGSQAGSPGGERPGARTEREGRLRSHVVVPTTLPERGRETFPPAAASSHLSSAPCSCPLKPCPAVPSDSTIRESRRGETPSECPGSAQQNSSQACSKEVRSRGRVCVFLSAPPSPSTPLRLALCVGAYLCSKAPALHGPFRPFVRMTAWGFAGSWVSHRWSSLLVAKKL